MMREAFLNDLKNALAGMKAEEIDSVLAYYSEMIDDRVEAGMSEEDAVNAMEPAATIASRVLSEAGVERQEELLEDNPVKEIRKSAENVTELSIAADNQRVRLTCGDTDEIVLRYRIEKGDVYQLHEESGRLSLEHTHRPVSSYKFDASKVTVDNLLDEVGKFIKGLNLGNLIQINGSSVNRCIEVQLPRVFKGRIDVKSCNARIMAENITCLDSLTLHTSNARIELTHVVGRAMKMESSNGRIVLEDVYVREVLDAITSNSRIMATGLTADQDVHLRTSNGRIEVESLNAKNMTLKTSNASIAGTVRGNAADFVIDSGTSNGRNNLTNSAEGEKMLVAKTSNGNINIDFVD